MVINAWSDYTNIKPSRFSRRWHSSLFRVVADRCPLPTAGASLYHLRQLGDRLHEAGRMIRYGIQSCNIVSGFISSQTQASGDQRLGSLLPQHFPTSDFMGDVFCFLSMFQTVVLRRVARQPAQVGQLCGILSTSPLGCPDASICPRGDKTRLPERVVICVIIPYSSSQLVLNVMSLLEYSFRTVVLF